VAVYLCVQKDPSKADDFPGERGAGDADTIEVITDAGAADDVDQEQSDGDKKHKDKTSWVALLLAQCLMQSAVQFSSVWELMFAHCYGKVVMSVLCKLMP